MTAQLEATRPVAAPVAPARTVEQDRRAKALWLEHARGDHRRRDRGPQVECVHCITA